MTTTTTTTSNNALFALFALTNGQWAPTGITVDRWGRPQARPAGQDVPPAKLVKASGFESGHWTFKCRLPADTIAEGESVFVVDDGPNPGMPVPGVWDPSEFNDRDGLPSWESGDCRPGTFRVVLDAWADVPRTLSVLRGPGREAFVAEWCERQQDLDEMEAVLHLVTAGSPAEMAAWFRGPGAEWATGEAPWWVDLAVNIGWPDEREVAAFLKMH